MTADSTKPERPSGEGESRRENRQANAQQEQQRTEERSSIGTTGKVDKTGNASTESKNQQKHCCIRCRPICNFVVRYRKMRMYEQLAIPINALTLLGIIAAGVIYYCQLTAMQGATEAATEAAKAAATQAAVSKSALDNSQRAHIVVTEMVNLAAMATDTPLRVRTRFRNVSGAPAFDVATQLFYQVGDLPGAVDLNAPRAPTPIAPTPTPNRTPPRGIIVGSISIIPGFHGEAFMMPVLEVGKSRTHEFVTYPTESDKLEKVIAGNQALYVTAEIKFRDLTGVHVESGCMVYQTRDAAGFPTDPQFTPCLTGSRWPQNRQSSQDENR
jgi:hypothetical protein